MGKLGTQKTPPPKKSKITPCCSFSCCFQVGSGPCQGITSVTWFNVTESFPGLQGPPLGRRGREPRLARVNFGCTFPCCLFGVFCFVFILSKQIVKGWKNTIRIWSSGGEEGARTRSILLPAKAFYSPNSSFRCHIPRASSKVKGMSRARQPGHPKLPGDSPGGCGQLWGPRRPRLSLAGCVCSAALITETWRNAVSRSANISPGKRQPAAAVLGFEWAPVPSIPHLPPQIRTRFTAAAPSPNTPAAARAAPRRVGDKSLRGR